MNVVFLDFDGVVNTPMWEERDGVFKCGYGWPEDGKVNNWQAVQWLSEFCIEYGYSIVVSSTWRSDGLEKCTEYLKAGGLRDGIEVVDITPSLPSGYRGEEINAWLDEHPDVTQFIIIDDDSDMKPYMDHLVKCDSCVGFLGDAHSRAIKIHNKFELRGEGSWRNLKSSSLRYS